ncbi:hypothetical protein CGZ93_03105 [Enemella dayhoffiae]|uniref:DUF112 domain-containing protein n=1 Tax=Enemella dayhoffiae TaxID=2016507 RepID=A0A255HBH8_9ACTN|nr:hypothetical protein CGZ93_03105 [Enemella dayhoffiae]
MAGVHSINNDVFDMFVVIGFGIIGWLMKKTGFEPGPLVLAFVLGPLLEQSFRQSMLIAKGDASIFVTRPISGAILGGLVLTLVVVTVLRTRVRRTLTAPAATEGEAGNEKPKEGADASADDSARR